MKNVTGERQLNMSNLIKSKLQNGEEGSKLLSAYTFFISSITTTS